MNLAEARKTFIHNYCRTCHSMQGLSVGVPITIYDWKSKWVTRKWIYTAVTRARELNNVAFKEYREQANPKDEADLNRYLRDKVSGNMQQDRIAGRHVNKETYITAEWLRNCIGRPCHNSCGDCLTYERNDQGRIVSNITAQRLDNDLGHELENVVPMCMECNRQLSNRT